MENKNKYGLLWIGLIFGILLGGLVVYFVMVKNNKDNVPVSNNTKTENKVDENNSDEKEEKSNPQEKEVSVNDINVYELDINKLEEFLRYNCSTSDSNIGESTNNILNTANKRLAFVSQMFKAEDISHTDGKIKQSVSYVTKDTFKEEYESIFGNNYNFNNDFAKNDSGDWMIYNCNEEEKEEKFEYGNYICWYESWGENSATVSLTIKNKIIENDMYKIKGNYIYDLDGTKNNGEFVLDYSLNGKNAFLKNLVFNKNN